MLKKAPPHQASTGEASEPKRFGTRTWSRDTTGTALASATSVEKPAPRTDSGRRPAVTASGTAGESHPEKDREPDAARRGADGRRHEAEDETQQDDLAHELQGQRRQGDGEDAAGPDEAPPAPQGGSPQGEHDEGRPGQGLEEQVEVERREGEASEGVHDAGGEGPHRICPELAGEGEGGDRGEREMEGEEPRRGHGSGKEGVEEVQGVEHREDERRPRR